MGDESKKRTWDEGSDYGGEERSGNGGDGNRDGDEQGRGKGEFKRIKSKVEVGEVKVDWSLPRNGEELGPELSHAAAAAAKSSFSLPSLVFNGSLGTLPDRRTVTERSTKVAFSRLEHSLSASTSLVPTTTTSMASITPTPTTTEQTETETYSLIYPTPSSSSQPIPNTPFQQPTQLTMFSYTSSRELVFDNSALKYYVEPPRGSKLGYGYEKWVKQVEERGRLDSLLKALIKVKEDSEEGRERVRGLGVVSWRGVMTKILTAPYEERDGWEMNVMKINGTLYFEEYVSEKRLLEKQNMKERQLIQTYYGYGFESYCTSDTPRQRPKHDPKSKEPYGWSGDVNNNLEWCSVVRTKLGNTRILIGGEVDCIKDKYTGQPNTFVELKTSMNIRGPADEQRFEKKLLKFYFQSFLLGVPEIVVGFRTPAGVLNTVQSFSTVHIPRLVRGKPGAWDPLLCLDWGNRFLSFLQNSIRTSGPKVWRVAFSPGVGVSIRQLTENETTSEVMRGEARVGFVPEWFWNVNNSDN